MSDATTVRSGLGRRRWLILGVIGLAQLMVVLDLTVMNIALPTIQRALHFTAADRQWVVTAYALAFGSLLLLGGRLADLLGRKETFLVGLVGFAGVSAVGGASVNFAMLVTARACQGVFAALLVPSALSLLTTTFAKPEERGKAFGVFGAIAVAGGAVGLLLGGALTEYLSWRWTLYVNLVFAVVAFTGGTLLLQRQPSQSRPRLDIPGVLAASGGVFCLVYGFSNAGTHGWGAPSAYGFLAAGVALLAAFAGWEGRTPHPLLPPRVVLDRDRGGAYVSMLVAGAGLFGTFFFLTYYLQVEQDRFRAGPAGQQVGQLAVDAVEDGGPQQQVLDTRRLALQHLGDQVLRDRAVTAGELRDEPLRVRVAGQGQRREPQARGPPLGPLVQPRRPRRRQRDPRGIEQRPGLAPGKAQVGRADLG
jgi:MFS family permease